MGGFFGLADQSISVFGNYLEYSRQLSKKYGWDAKLTSLVQSGNGLSAFGLSDLFLNANFKANERLKITVGAKIPLSKANKTFDNLPLPMDYQASLGTFDVLLGFGYEIKRYKFIAAIQQPLTQNGNQFEPRHYPTNSKLSTFQSTNQYKRSGDVLLRISYALPIHSKLKLTPSLLPLYHLFNDSYLDEIQMRREIAGSKGLTLNGNVYLDYEINRRNFIQLNIAAPFIVRASRPDGLTRSFIANIEYRIKF